MTLSAIGMRIVGICFLVFLAAVSAGLGAAVFLSGAPWPVMAVLALGSIAFFGLVLMWVGEVFNLPD